VQGRLHREKVAVDAQLKSLGDGTAQRIARAAHVLDRLGVRLSAVDPRLVLQRGYALLSDANGLPLTSVRQAQPGQAVVAALADGEVDLTVASAPRPRA
jgi:exodeoxyribonuclease VII large subunit